MEHNVLTSPCCIALLAITSSAKFCLKLKKNNNCLWLNQLKLIKKKYFVQNFYKDERNYMYMKEQEQELPNIIVKTKIRNITLKKENKS